MSRSRRPLFFESLQFDFEIDNPLSVIVGSELSGVMLKQLVATSFKSLGKLSHGGLKLLLGNRDQFRNVVSMTSG